MKRQHRTGNTSHGFARRGKRHPLYIAWSNMIQRCTNPKASRYPSYGGRGIKVCPDWQERFERFAKDVGHPPEERYDLYSLDRMDPDGNYEPDNVRWVLRLEQSRNKRSTVRVDHEGENSPLVEVLERMDSPLKPATVRARLRAGMSPRKALSSVLGLGVCLSMRARDRAILAELKAGTLYATEDGRIFDLVTRRQLTPTSNADGYQMVSVPRIGRTAGSCRRVLVSRVVALQYLENADPGTYPIVHHRDGDRGNNAASNLAWCSHGANSWAIHAEEGGTESSDKCCEAGWAPRRVVNRSPLAWQDVRLLVDEGAPPSSAPPVAKESARPSLAKLPAAILRKAPEISRALGARDPMAVLSILQAPSNLVVLDGDRVLTFVCDRDGRVLAQKEVQELAPTDRVYFGCADCGYESALPLEVRTRIGNGSKARTPVRKGLDVCACTSLAVQFPELDRLRRPDPTTGLLPHGTEIPAKTADVRAYVHCADCGRDRARPVSVKPLVSSQRLPRCEACESTRRARNLPSHRAVEGQPCR